jgi:type IV pilus assembly protein PilQ
MKIRSIWAALLIPALVAAAPPPDAVSGSVTTLRLEGREGRTELTVEISGGQVRWTDFSLAGPPRVVVDIAGARSSLPGSRYEGLDRGGVRGVRTSQHAPDVVRVVVDLDRETGYAVERVPEGLRISLRTGAQAFRPWSAGGNGAAPASRDEPAYAVLAEAAPMPALAVPAARTRPQAAQQIQQPRARPITVTFEQTDMRDVLASFAEFSGRSIVPGAGVGAIRVDYVQFEGQPWDLALRTLLQAYGLAAEELPGGIIRVDRIEMLQQRAAAEPLVTQPFRINYVPAAELAATFAGMITERGSLAVNTATNTLIITDVEGVVRDLRGLIAILDVPVPQVSIEAKIIFVDRTQLDALGIQYDLKDLRGSSFGTIVETPGFDPVTGLPTGTSTPVDRFLLGGRSIAAVANAAADIPDATLNIAVSLLLANRFSLVALISALQETSIADVQAMPQITTLDNRTARIFVGEEITFLTAAGAGGVGGAVTLQPVQVEAGIVLEVTPHITADGRVRMSLNAENSLPTLTAANLLNVSRQQATNEVLVADGETIVIGGLTVTRIVEVRSGIPFLMDLPILGGLFRSTRREERKQDLLVLVTPHIIPANDF